MPDFRFPETREKSEALEPAQPSGNQSRRFDPVKWIAAALFVVTGAAFALSLVATTWGIGHVPDVNAVQEPPAKLLAPNTPRP